MSSIKLISETPVSLVELKEKIEAIESRDKELNFRANKVKDYLNKTVKLDHKKAVELKNNLIKLEIPRLKDRHIAKIIDILPSDMEDLKTVFVSDVTTVNPENMEKLLEAVKPYLPKSKK